MIRALAALSLVVMSSCLQPVDDCWACVIGGVPDAGSDAGAGGGAGGGGGTMRVDGGTWACRLPPPTTMDPWCSDSPNAQYRCADATLVGEGRTGSLTSDSERVAWTVIDAQANGTVWVATRDGGAPTCVSSYSYPALPAGAVSLRNGFIYWTDFSAARQRGLVMRASLEGGDAEIFVDEDVFPSAFVTSDTHAYWIPHRSKEIRRKALAGGNAVPFATGDNPGPIVIDGAWVYWIDELSKKEIRRAPSTGIASPSTLVTLTREIGQIQAKNGFIYWLASGDAAVYRRPLTGGSDQLVSSNPATVLTFHTDGTRIYWFLDISSNLPPALFSAPLAGPAQLLLSPSAYGPIAVEGNDLYFGGQTLRRLPK